MGVQGLGGRIGEGSSPLDTSNYVLGNWGTFSWSLGVLLPSFTTVRSNCVVHLLPCVATADVSGTEPLSCTYRRLRGSSSGSNGRMYFDHTTVWFPSHPGGVCNVVLNLVDILVVGNTI